MPCPHRKAVEHLRALLIATEILPPDPGRDLRWLDRDLPALLGELTVEISSWSGSGPAGSCCPGCAPGSIRAET